MPDSQAGPTSASAASTPAASDPHHVYSARIERFTRDRDLHKQKATVVSNVRGVVFLALIGAGLLAELRPGTLPLLLAFVLGIAFIALVVHHGRLRARERRAESMRTLNQSGIDRLERDWDTLQSSLVAPAGHRYADDLDLFGQASLAKLLGPIATPPGVRTVRSWLLGEEVGGRRLDAAVQKGILGRQAQVQSLTPELETRQEFARVTQDAVATADDLESFFDWAEDDHAPPSTLLRAASFLLPLTFAGLVAVALLGGPGRLWLAPILATGWLTFGRVGARMRGQFERAFGRENVFRAYPELFVMMEDAVAGTARPGPDEIGGQEQARTAAESTRALGAARPSAALRPLYGIMQLADVRHSTWLYPILALTTLWDAHVTVQLDAWRRQHGRAVRAWFDRLGRFEALCALASLGYDNPSWCYARVMGADDDGVEGLISARQLGHPLIPPAQRVDNDVQVGPPGTFVFITGSNMSGKSTLLRAIGLNAVLAFAGAPACARKLSLPVFDVRTSIRIEDSLERGVSLFMAELERLKSVVDAADRVRDEATAAPVLYLFDEVLHGTNTAERRIAAARVIRHLLDAGAIGAVTSHDLELAADPAIHDAAQPVHFRESVREDDSGPLISFDYRLRSGVATTTNALALLRQMGLDTQRT